MNTDYIVIRYYERLALQVPGVPDAFPAWGRVTVRTMSKETIFVAACVAAIVALLVVIFLTAVIRNGRSWKEVEGEHKKRKEL